ncbi:MULTISPECIES: restriction endonuclease [unclassified Polaromonas]|jgi:hypothetical protein|uniref:restriction endonuclease n=1 Tax=unclassified Polaromonas TaxID=2638319 RepID=UPI000BCA02F5|nr:MULTISPECIES: restriction endonuclease [unclassified Polaromonas]OZA87030.1 MAG: hypothetical protein B7X65_14470 [Polaromonas sp. 39-63-25]HQR97136.1 restriction endonuclease [Polaromonas sp.]HQS41219.1 restriction endonuclease [Polaromonas sp.]HQS85224.1 restriction endonuclease [Polaromonas sp.]HQT06156.1 restriction endonuclease [Polaromonas sp.]
MTTASDNFEKRIQRIHDLIEQPNSEVIWNDRIPDPDTPSQQRQIDVSIRRGGKLTLVECRIHQAVQDVKWIEELIGRRVSLNADAVIAVSNSGFTKNARAKAKAFGIILRDFQSLTAEEIMSWGEAADIALTYFEYREISIRLGLAGGATPPPDDLILEQLEKSGLLFKVIQEASDRFDQEVVPEFRKFHLTCRISEVSFGDADVEQVWMTAEVRRVTQEVATPSVVAYDAPETNAVDRGTVVQQLELGDFEITHASDNICIAADLGDIALPSNSFFYCFAVRFKKAKNLLSMEVIRPPPFRISLRGVKMQIAFRDKSEK